MLKLQFLTGKKHNEEWSTVKNCNFSKLQFFKCTFTVISLHIFAVYMKKMMCASYYVVLVKGSTQEHPSSPISIESGTQTKQATFLGSIHARFLTDLIETVGPNKV